MLGICLLFKDSAQYLEEWLLFHHIQGFRRFFLYNNESSDNWEAVLDPWIKMGAVSVFSCPGTAVQREVYDDCLLRAKDSVDWLAFIDDDEFIYTNDGCSLEAALFDYADYAGIAVSWLLFGSGGIESWERKWVIDRFQLCAGSPDPHVKCIVRPKYVQHSKLIGHVFEPMEGYSVVDENKRPIAVPLNPRPSINRFCINHYLVKSWAEWKIRRNRPQADTGKPTPHPEAAWRGWDASWSSVHNANILRYRQPMLELAQKLSLPSGTCF